MPVESAPSAEVYGVEYFAIVGFFMPREMVVETVRHEFGV